MTLLEDCCGAVSGSRLHPCLNLSQASHGVLCGDQTFYTQVLDSLHLIGIQRPFHRRCHLIGHNLMLLAGLTFKVSLLDYLSTSAGLRIIPT